jgi:hypothetical protein
VVGAPGRSRVAHIVVEQGEGVHQLMARPGHDPLSF